MRTRPFLILAAAGALTGCTQPPELSVDGAYVRLPAVAGRPGVAYFTVHGATEGTKLISVTSPVVIRSELHESMKSGAMSSMAPIRDVPVPARAELVFAPGGKHVMLFDINQQVKPGSTVKLLFTFANNTRITVQAPAIAAGAPAPTR